MKTKLKKVLTIQDFTAIVEYEQIEKIMGFRRYKKFIKWMNGQTSSSPNGCYVLDLERYLTGNLYFD